MTHDKLLDLFETTPQIYRLINALGDIPMTNQQLGAREERTKLLAEIKQAIEKELG